MLKAGRGFEDFLLAGLIKICPLSKLSLRGGLSFFSSSSKGSHYWALWAGCWTRPIYDGSLGCSQFWPYMLGTRLSKNLGVTLFLLSTFSSSYSTSNLTLRMSIRRHM